MTFRQLPLHPRALPPPHHDLRIGDVVAFDATAVLEIQTSTGACVAAWGNVNNHLPPELLAIEAVVELDLGWLVDPRFGYKRNGVRVAERQYMGRYLIVDIAQCWLVERLT